MNINLKQLEAFCALVEYQSFTKASEALFLTQSTISSHISALEKETGVRLAERSCRRKITITAEGEKLYRHAVNILKECRKLEREFCHEECEISVAASTIPSQYILPRLMSRFLRENFNIRFALEKGDSTMVLKLLKEGGVRIGFLGVKEPDESLVYQIYCEDHLVFVTPNQERYRQAAKQRKYGKDMMDEPLILRRETSGTMKEFGRYLRERGIEESSLTVVARINDPETIKSAVMNGMGATIMSNLAVEEEVRDGRLLKFELDEKRFRRYIYAAWKKETRLTEMERRFVSPDGFIGNNDN